MNSYIITYDLINKRDYDKLIQRIKSYANATHVQESVWIVKNDSQFGSKEIRDELQNFIDSDDRLFVAKLTGEAAWRGSIDSTDNIKKAL